MANIYRNAKVDFTNTDNTTVYTSPSNSRAIVKSILVSDDSGSGDSINVTLTDASAAVFSLFKTKAIASNTNIGFLLLQGLSNRVMQTESIIESLTQKDISSKLVNYLLLLCKDFGVTEGARIIIDLHISHQEIADAIGSTRVTITKLIGELKRLGLLAVHRKKIIILDHMKLANRFK